MPKDKKDETVAIDIGSIELRTELGDVKAMLSNVLKNQTSGNGAGPKSPDALVTVGREETSEERVERETNSSTVHRSQQQAIKFQRVAGSYMDALIGVTEEHSDFNDAKALSVIDLGSRQDNMIKLADQMGKKPRGEWVMKHLTTLVAIFAVTVVAVAMLQPAALEIISHSLSNPRNEFVLVGVVVLGLCLVAYERISRQRAAKKATMQ